MKILLITDFLPTIDNYRGPSSLCFYLLKSMNTNHNIKVITTNANKVPVELVKKAEEDLGIKYDIIPRNFWMKLITSSKTGALFTPIFGNSYGYLSRYSLSLNIMKEIDEYNPDIIYIYPYHLIKVAEQMCPKYKTVVIGPDCSVLGALRRMSDNYVYDKNEYETLSQSYLKRIKIENKLASLNCYVALVGRADCEMFNIVTNSKKAFFLPHPHYGLRSKTIDFRSGKIKIVITGGYDSFTHSDVNKMVEALMNHPDSTLDCEFTFLGKSWKPIVDLLKNHCKVSFKEWVENYDDEIIKYDAQIIPISYGVGTKGKVLDAMANGLLCIGSKYAMENIACKNEENCLIYHSSREIPSILKKICYEREKYMMIAEKGRECVRKYHSPSLCADILLKYSVGEASVQIDPDLYYS